MLLALRKNGLDSLFKEVGVLKVLAKRHFSGEGGGLYFEPPRGRNFIPPPLCAPHPWKGVCRGGGWGCIKFGPLFCFGAFHHLFHGFEGSTTAEP